MSSKRKDFLIDLLKRLLKLRDKQKHKYTEGICQCLTYAQKQHVAFIFEIWPKYSGHIDFPVPSPHNHVSHGLAYFKYNRWSKKSNYGQLRYELLDFLITTLEKQIKDLS